MTNFKARAFIVVLCMIWGAVSSYANIAVPENTVAFLYVRDIVNLEDNLRKNGLMNMDKEYIDYLLHYFEDRELIGNYRSFRALEGGDIVKSLVGEVCFINIMNDYVILVEARRGSNFFVRAMNAVSARNQVYGYFVDTVGKYIILGKNSATVSYFKRVANTRLKDNVLDEFNERAQDIIYYKTGQTVIHPFADRVLGMSGNKKRFALGVEFATKSLTLFGAPFDSDIKPPFVRRANEYGAYSPSDALFFLDTMQNPGIVLSGIFGNPIMMEFITNFRTLFEDQCHFSINGLSREIQPSFVFIAKSRRVDDADARFFFRDFLSKAMGEEKWNNVRLGIYTGFEGDRSKAVYFEHNGYFVVSDNRAGAQKALTTVAGRNPSVWDISATRNLKRVGDKNSAYFINFENLAQSIYTSMLYSIRPDNTKREHLRAFMRPVKDLGNLVGYSEQSKDYTRYFMVLSPISE
jgi:hypothetical protein